MNEYVSVPITQVQIGDILNVNIGYRPLDDEDCEVLDIRDREGLFGDLMKEFLVKTPNGKMWLDFPTHGQYGNKPKFEYNMTKLVLKTKIIY